MSGQQVLRIETREKLRAGNVRHVSGLSRDPMSRPVAEPVVALAGADYKAARKALRSAPRRTGRKPHEAVELVLAGPPPYDGTGGEPWTLERERAWAHSAYGWVRTILGPESVIAAAAWHRDETAPHVHVLAVPRPEGGGGRIGWCARRDQAVSRICAGDPAGSRYRVLQDDLYAQVSLHFGLGRGVVGSEAQHEAIDRAKALEARARKAERDAAQAAELMWKLRAEQDALLAQIGKSMEKADELRERTEQAQARATEAEERARQAGAGTYADGVAACLGAMQAPLAAVGYWPKLMAWAPFRAWAEQAHSGVLADVDWAGEVAKAQRPAATRRAPASGMER